jgi:uncharacterized membrane protein YjjB (DUF3815 family)
MLEVIIAFIASLCAAVLFNVNKRNLFLAGLSGTFGWLAFSWLLTTWHDATTATFFGALTVGLYSEIMARIMKSPATIYSVSGIFPIVPGIGAYNTIQCLVESNLAEAAGMAVETAAQAGAIAFGILINTAVFRIITRLKCRTR